MIRIGTAGWAIPRTSRERFPEGGSGLQRYAARLNCAEINSSFYRPHRPSTWTRWAADTPCDFRFSVKLPRTITHDQRLVDPGERLDAFLAEARLLGEKLGPLLVQLPPSLAFDPAVAATFFEALRLRHEGLVACEPRHATWFEADADVLLQAHRIARVAADPVRHPKAGEPGGWDGLRYWRLHGSPRMYWSSYDAPWLDRLGEALQAGQGEAWCIFDNTSSGAAAANALDLAAQLD